MAVADSHLVHKFASPRSVGRSGWLLPGILVCWFGTTWHGFAHTFGLRIVNDSAVFMTHAMQIWHNADFSIPTNRGPLYIIELALALFIQPFPDDAAALLSGIHLYAVLALTALLVGRILQSSHWAACAVLALGLLPGHLHMYTAALTEPTFATCVVAHVLCLCLYHNSRRFQYFVLAAVCASAAALTRYIGYSVLLSFFGYALFAWRGQPYRAKWRLLVSSVAFLPSATYAFCNYWTTGHAHGGRSPAIVGLWHNVSLTATTLVSDLGILLLPIVVALVWSVSRWCRRQPAAWIDVSIRYTGILIGAYLALLLYGTSTVRIDPISTRYFAPIYPLLLFLAFAPLGLQAATSNRPTMRRRLVAIVFGGLVFLGIAGQKSEMQAILWHFEKRTDARGSHLSAGFNRTTTSVELRRLVTRLARKTNHGLVITAVSDPSRGRKARALFFRRHMFPLSVDQFEATIQTHSNKVDISWKWMEDGTPKSVHYFEIARSETIEGFRASLVELLERIDNRKVFLIYEHSKRNRHLFGEEGLDAHDFPDLIVKPVATVHHYVLYDCQLS